MISVILIIIIIALLIYFFKKSETKDFFSALNNNKEKEMKYDMQNEINGMTLDTPINTYEEDLDGLINYTPDINNNTFSNPLLKNINPNRNEISGVNQTALQSLIEEINTGNNIPDNSERNKLFQQKTKSIDSAKTYRNVNYADSNYRTDFNGDGVSPGSQELLDKMYDQSLIFQNNEFSDNANFTGNPDGIGNDYGPANLGDFGSNNKKSQKEKLLNMFDSNNYLPNSNLTNSDLTKGFQILENPVSVDNPNLIPVQRSIPVSSTLGNSRNSSWDIRGDIPNPKTVVAPWNNSSINPDIYSSNRGCL